MDIYLERLIERSEFAYEQARTEVFDVVPGAVSLESRALSARQRSILLEVEAAEADVRAYRMSRLAFA